MPVIQSAERGAVNETAKHGFRMQQAWNKIASWRAATSTTRRKKYLLNCPIKDHGNISTNF